MDDEDHHHHHDLDDIRSAIRPHMSLVAIDDWVIYQSVTLESLLLVTVSGASQSKTGRVFITVR